MPTTSQTLTAGAGYGSPVYISENIHNTKNPTVVAIPGSGGTMNVQYTVSDATVVSAGSANWIDWPGGSVSSSTSDSLIGKVTAVRANATTANGTLEVNQ